MISQIQSAAATVHTDVLAALRTAAHKTGLDFDYLLNTAMRESKLDSQAKSKNSSASGLFQFIDQTWLGLVKQYGERYGLGSYAGAIQKNSSGRYVVASDDTKAAILALRQDPELSAVMAGESAKQTKQSLECALGRKVCAGELYAAHFLGPSGARNLIQLSESNPNMRADIAFPQAAKANKSMFCRADGSAKTVGEVYASVVNRPPQIPVGRANLPPLQMAPAPANPPPQMIAANIEAADIGNKLMSATKAPAADSNRIALSDEDEPQERAPANPYAIWTSPQQPAAGELRLLPQAPVVLSAGFLEMLASMTPATINRRAV